MLAISCFSKLLRIMHPNEFENASLTKTVRSTICNESAVFLAAKELRGKEEK